MFYNFLGNIEDIVVRKQFLETLRDEYADTCLFRCKRCVYRKRCLYQKIYNQIPFNSFCKFGGWGTMQYLSSDVHQYWWNSVSKFDVVFHKIFRTVLSAGNFGKHILFYSKANNYKTLNLFSQASVLHLIDACALKLMDFEWLSESQVALFVTVEEMSQAVNSDKIDKWLKIPSLVLFGNFDNFRQSSRFVDNYQILNERAERGLCNFVYNSASSGADCQDLLRISFNSVIDVDGLGDLNGDA